MIPLLVVLACLSAVRSFLVVSPVHRASLTGQLPVRRCAALSNAVSAVDIDVPLGDGYQDLTCSFKPLYQSSEFVVGLSLSDAVVDCC